MLSITNTDSQKPSILQATILLSIVDIVNTMATLAILLVGKWFTTPPPAQRTVSQSEQLPLRALWHMLTLTGVNPPERNPGETDEAYYQRVEASELAAFQEVLATERDRRITPLPVQDT